MGAAFRAEAPAILLLAVLGKLSDGLLKQLETRALHWRDSFVGGEG